MTNPVKGEAQLKLADGREFTLTLDFEGLVQAETAYGKPLPKLMSDAAAGFVGAARALLWGALRAKHPGISLADASAMFMTDMDTVTVALDAAVEISFPDQSNAESTEGKKGAHPRGKTSGGSGAKQD